MANDKTVSPDPTEFIINKVNTSSIELTKIGQLLSNHSATQQSAAVFRQAIKDGCVILSAEEVTDILNSISNVTNNLSSLNGIFNSIVKNNNNGLTGQPTKDRAPGVMNVADTAKNILNKDFKTWIFDGNLDDVLLDQGFMFSIISKDVDPRGFGVLKPNASFMRYKNFIKKDYYSPKDILNWSEGFYGYDAAAKRMTQLYIKINDTVTVWDFGDNGEDGYTDILIGTNDNSWMSIKQLTKSMTVTYCALIQQNIKRIVKEHNF